MFILTLQRDGKIIHKERKKAVSTKGEILAYLGYIVELEKGFTIRDLFKVITKYKALQLIDNYFFAFLKEVKKCPKSGCKDKDMAAIAFQKICSTDFGENHTYIDIHAATKKPDKDGQTRYAVDFMPLSKMLDLPIIFDPILICSMAKNAKEEYRYEHPTDYTLWELVHGFIWELSFYGVPAERDEKKKEVMDRMEEVENGTAVLIPFEEIKTKMKQLIAAKKKGKNEKGNAS